MYWYFVANKYFSALVLKKKCDEEKNYLVEAIRKMRKKDLKKKIVTHVPVSMLCHGLLQNIDTPLLERENYTGHIIA